METNKWFIENSRIHAPLIMNDIKSKINNLLEASPERI
jgi:thioredoxin reductase (NADPH)